MNTKIDENDKSGNKNATQKATKQTQNPQIKATKRAKVVDKKSQK